MSVLVVGSIALDTVKTPVEEHSDLLGGSACYAALGASFFSPVRLVGIVGDDFPESEFEFWKSRKIDSEGVQRVNGKTFRWSGEYAWDLNTRETRSIALNVFEHFKPVLPESYRQTDFVLLANIAPSLQSHVLDQMERPRFVVADTMDLWIETTRSDLDALLRRVDLLILNDSEAREITKETSLIKAGRRIRKMGPQYVAIKKGEHGALLFGEDDQFFSCGAYPLEDIHDPTGAGDTFAGGMAGYLAGTVKKVHFNDLRKAMIYGSVLASFCVEKFSLERLRTLSMEKSRTLRDVQTNESIRGAGVMTTAEHEYRRLLHRTLIATVLCIGAVLVCYFWIDRPVAFFVYRHHINTIRVFQWLTYPPPEVQNWSALVLTILMVRRAWGPFLRWQKVLLVACLSLIIADDFRISLGDVCGRYWPETWTRNNPSLIGTGDVRLPSVSARGGHRQLSVRSRLQNPGVRHGLGNYDAPQSNR